jgi:divinyl protochlorophyllide a 8-vinyl-reductase
MDGGAFPAPSPSPTPAPAEAGAGPRIGPNAIHQLIAVLDHCEGRVTRDLVVEQAGIALPPPDAGMWPEAECAALHRAVRCALPDRADGLLRLAGLSTGDYILAHRIPRLARALVRALPAPLGARLLTAAIRRHAWTFAGSGAFRVTGWAPLTFELAANPLIAGEQAEQPLCHWHAAVFERLFARLVWPSAVVREVACAATGAPACRFELRPRAGR